jgi:hypothetical protein
MKRGMPITPCGCSEVLFSQVRRSGSRSFDIDLRGFSTILQTRWGRAPGFTVAYEMLGSAADAEDAVQETWLRWDAMGGAARDDVRDPRAFLVRMVTVQGVDRCCAA